MDSPGADFGANERSAREQWVARCRVTLTGHTGPVRYVAWAAMGGRPRIATAGDDGTARVWDPADGREVTRLEGHSSPVWHLAWGELDGQPVLATASRRGTARVWDPEGGRELFKCYHDRRGGVWCVSWADVAGQLLLATAGDDGWACVWDISTNSLVGRRLRASEAGAVYAVAWGVMDGRQVLATAGADGTACVWDISTSTLVGPPLGGGPGAGSVFAVAWGQLDGRQVLATAGDDHAARVWDLASGQEIETLGVRRTRRVAWGELNGRPALAASGDGAAVMVFPDRLQHSLNGHTITVHDVQWATLGGRPVIATAAGDHTARVWDPVDGGELVTITGHAGPVYSAAWGDLDGKPVLATASQDGTTRISELRIEQFAGLLPSYESDEINLSGTPDPLGRDPEAVALAELVCARSALPPLAVGIFGDWGEGKSYFMKQVSRHVDRLASAVRDSERSGHEDPLTYGEVRQVWFSAWHYAETDLWASLVAVLFEELAAGAKNAEIAQRQGSRLASEIITQRAVRERLAAAESRRNELGEWLHAGLAVTAWRDFRRSWPRVVLGFALLAAAIAAGLWAWRSSPTWNPLQAIASLILAAAAFAGAVTAALRPLGDAWQATVGLSHSAAKIVNEARRWDDSRRLKLQTAFDVAEAEVSALQEELRDLTAAGQLAGLVRQRADVGDYRSQLGLMTRIRHDFTQMAELLERERQQRQSSAAGAYKSGEDDVGDQLPAIDRIVLYIDDLDRCPPDRVVAVLEAVHLLLAVPLFVVVVAVDPRWLLKSLSVHYRDMLDPLNKEGPRDITGGVTHPTATGSESENVDDLWSSTPMNYLEKIFQVPFTLQPVSQAGYEQLVASLTGDHLQQAREREADSRQLGGKSPGSAPADTPSLRQLSDRQAKAREPRFAGREIRRWVRAYRDSREARLPRPKSEGAEPEPRLPETPAYVPELPGPPSDGRADPLALTADERRLLKILGPGLVTSPRSVKRLVNSYGLLNALRGRQRARDLMPHQDPGTRQSWHPYRAALVLLATLIGFPTESPALFETLYRRARSLPATTWAEFVDELEPQFTGDKQWANACGKWSQAQARSWAALTSALRDVHNAAEDTDRVGSPSLNLPCPLAAWAEWVVPVGRLSFHTGQVVAELDRRPALNESGDYEKTSQPSQNSNIPIRASDLR